MTVLSAQTIRKLSRPHGYRGLIGWRWRSTELPLIEPFSERTIYGGCTYGLDSAGFDMRVAADVDLYPGSVCRVDAIEKFNVPRWLYGSLTTKSTWAREFVVQIGTKMTSGWRGNFRLELYMPVGAPKPVHILAGTGLVNVAFHILDKPTAQPYPDDGKYMDQPPGQNAIFEDA